MDIRASGGFQLVVVAHALPSRRRQRPGQGDRVVRSLGLSLGRHHPRAAIGQGNLQLLYDSLPFLYSRSALFQFVSYYFSLV